MQTAIFTKPTKLYRLPDRVLKATGHLSWKMTSAAMKDVVILSEMSLKHKNENFLNCIRYAPKLKLYLILQLLVYSVMCSKACIPYTSQKRN